MLAMTFGERLDFLRVERGLNKTQLAKELHISTSTLSGYLHDRREPDFGTLTAFADYFEVSIDFLLGRVNYREALLDGLTSQEGELLGSYRHLNETGKNLLVQQAHFFEDNLSS